MTGWLPELVFENTTSAVIQVIEEKTGQVLYTVRSQNGKFQPRVYSDGTFAIKVGKDKPDGKTIRGLTPKGKSEAGQQTIRL